jgi:hypothetical protein
MRCSFGEYLKEVKSRLDGTKYTSEDIENNKIYFHDCWRNNQSSYRALDYLRFELYGDK